MTLSLKTIASIVLVLLKLADKLSDALLAKKYRDQGYEQAKAELTAKMLAGEKRAKQVMDFTNSLDANATDEFLHELEPK